MLWYNLDGSVFLLLFTHKDEMMEVNLKLEV